MNRSQIPAAWESEHLNVRDSSMEELDQLQGVFDACAYIGEWVGPAGDKFEKPMLAALEGKDIPPDGSKELHRVQSIRVKQREEIIGYLCLYHGFPDEKRCWIASFAIDPKFQKQKYGQEVIGQLIEEVRNIEQFTSMGLSVSVKNWPALRFWVRCGFNEILNIEGDKVHSEKTFADLWLGKNL